MCLRGVMGLWCSRAMGKTRAGMTATSSPIGRRLWRGLRLSSSFTVVWKGCLSGDRDGCSSGCHFDGTDCPLATRLVQLIPAVVESLPACRIRPHCRWFLQEGSAACRVCPQVVTYCVDP